MSEKELIKIIKFATDSENVTADTNFVDDLGCDSLDIFNIMIQIENEFNVMLPDSCYNGEVLTVKGILNSL